jgi:hypothetical protein
MIVKRRADMLTSSVGYVMDAAVRAAPNIALIAQLS